MNQPVRIVWYNPTFLLVALFLFSPLFAVLLNAAQLQTGPYTVNVDIRSNIMQIIPHAVINCKASGKSIKVSASAPGYVPQSCELPIKPGIMSYSTMLRLPDREKRLDVMTFSYKPIVSAYFDRYQGGTPTDMYAINLFLPIKSWPHPHPGNLKINQPGYGWPIQQSCTIGTLEDFYQVRMLIDRAVLDDPNDELLVYVNTAEVISIEAAGRWFAQLRQLERLDPNTASQLAAELSTILPVGLDSNMLPSTIAPIIKFRELFNTLHRD